MNTKHAFNGLIIALSLTACGRYEEERSKLRREVTQLSDLKKSNEADVKNKSLALDQAKKEHSQAASDAQDAHNEADKATKALQAVYQSPAVRAAIADDYAKNINGIAETAGLLTVRESDTAAALVKAHVAVIDAKNDLKQSDESQRELDESTARLLTMLEEQKAKLQTLAENLKTLEALLPEGATEFKKVDEMLQAEDKKLSDLINLVVEHEKQAKQAADDKAAANEAAEAAAAQAKADAAAQANADAAAKAEADAAAQAKADVAAKAEAAAAAQAEADAAAQAEADAAAQAEADAAAQANADAAAQANADAAATANADAAAQANADAAATANADASKGQGLKKAKAKKQAKN